MVPDWGTPPLDQGTHLKNGIPIEVRYLDLDAYPIRSGYQWVKVQYCSVVVLLVQPFSNVGVQLHKDIKI